MTQLEILKYAQSGALEIWFKERERCNANRDDQIAKESFEAIDEAYKEIVRRIASERLKMKQKQREEEDNRNF